MRRRNLHEVLDLREIEHLGWSLRGLAAVDGVLARALSTPPRDALPDLVTSPDPEVIEIAEDGMHEVGVSERRPLRYRSRTVQEVEEVTPHHLRAGDAVRRGGAVVPVDVVPEVSDPPAFDPEGHVAAPEVLRRRSGDTRLFKPVAEQPAAGTRVGVDQIAAHVTDPAPDTDALLSPVQNHALATSRNHASRRVYAGSSISHLRDVRRSGFAICQRFVSAMPRNRPSGPVTGKHVLGRAPDLTCTNVTRRYAATPWPRH